MEARRLRDLCCWESVVQLQPGPHWPKGHRDPPGQKRFFAKRELQLSAGRRSIRGNPKVNRGEGCCILLAVSLLLMSAEIDVQ